MATPATFDRINESLKEAKKLIYSTAEYGESTYRRAVADLNKAQGMLTALADLLPDIEDRAAVPSIAEQLVEAIIDLEKRIDLCQKYNGWTNYETWCVELWIDNEQGLYNHIKEMAREADNAYELAKQLESMVDDENPLASDASMFSDLLSAALREVDWMEIAEHKRPDEGWLDELDEDDPEDEPDEDGGEDSADVPGPADYAEAPIQLWDGTTMPFSAEFSYREWLAMKWGFQPDNDYWCFPTDPNDYAAEQRRYQ